jgi:hypothetical protein
MNDRAQAVEILRQARTVLAERLTEQVIEQAEEILADARGDSYMNEIETLYDQIGHKLTHVSQMLSNLPAESPPTDTTTAAAEDRPDATFSMATETSPSADAVVADTLPALVGPLYIATPALPAPRTGPAGESVAPFRDRATNAALQAFAAQIQAGDLLAAGRTLAALFDLEEPRAIACAAIFAQRARHEAGYFRKVMELRGELYSSNPQRALLLLLDCFGLTRGESAEILRTIQRRRRLHFG